MCARAPRLREGLQPRRHPRRRRGGGAKAKIFALGGRASASEKVALEQAGKPVPGGAQAASTAIANKLVFSKLQARLGGRIRALVSGAAPLAKEIAEFFAAAGLPISEGYGLTETSAGNFVNRPGGAEASARSARRSATSSARSTTDGEILLRGTPVMRGYHNLPEETAAAFTEDGLFRTGDIGELDADGFLRITDRKKDLVKTSGGKYIAPSATSRACSRRSARTPRRRS